MTDYAPPPTTLSGRKDIETRFASGTRHRRWIGSFAPVPVGHRFGLWEITDPTFQRDKSYIRVACRCVACGTVRTVDWHSLSRGRTKGCLCQSRLATNPYAEDWMRRVSSCMVSARYRCRNPKARNWDDYGGRGITFDFPSTRAATEWIVQHLGKPEPGQSLDRIDNDKGYAPGNIRWLKQSGQMFNTRRTKIAPPDWPSPYVATMTKKLLRLGLTRDDIMVRARLAVEEKRKGWRDIQARLASMTS